MATVADEAFNEGDRKRSRLSSTTAIISLNNDDKPQTNNEPFRRPSSLVAENMMLTGHHGEVFALDFNPSGSMIATAGRDRAIMLWSTVGECLNLGSMIGHANAVLDLKWAIDGETIVSCGADKSGMVWDVEARTRVKRLRHDGIVNSVDIRRRGQIEILTASDDSTVKIWDVRLRDERYTMEYTTPVTAVAHANEMIFTGGVDGIIRGYDVRKLESPLYEMTGHSDVITCLSLSPDSSYLLSNAIDATLRIWDIRPFAPADRNTKTFTGIQHGFERNLLRCNWSPDSKHVISASADRVVYVYRVRDSVNVARLPGHQGSVNTVAWHPTEPVVASGSSDKTVFLGELVLE